MILSRRELRSGWGGWELILNPDWMESIEAIPECPLREGYLMATLEWSLSSEFDDRVPTMAALQIGRASCRERVCQDVSIAEVAVSLKKQHHEKKDKKTHTHR